MGASNIEIERKTKASLLYVDPAWPVVWSFAKAGDDWEDYTGKSPFPTLRAAKKAADIGAAEDGRHCFVVDKADRVVHEAHPKPRRVVRRPRAASARHKGV